MSEIIAALLGAAAAGVFQTIVGVLNRRHQAEAMLVAIASEVDAICRLIQHRRYLEVVSESADAIRKGTWDGQSLIIDIREDYFSVFHANSSNIGALKPSQACLIVNFYSYCKSAIDSVRPDGPFAGSDASEYASENILELEQIFTAIISLGRQITALPKEPLILGEAK